MLPSRSGRARSLAAAGLVYVLGFACPAARSAEPQPSPQPTKSGNPLLSVPLPVGQEVKGLVLPDFDMQGRLRARFEAGVAKRLDPEHIGFSSLKLTTFTPESAVELLIDIPASTLDLNSRVITSHARTIIRRRDFNISGDSLEFDTVARRGTLRGNVQMLITDQSELLKKPGE